MIGLRLLRVLLLLTVLCVPALGAEEPFHSMRLKWREIILPQTGINTNDPDYSAWIASSASVAQAHWALLQTNAAFLWTDLSGLSTNSSHISASYSRLRAMALGYSIPGSALHRHPSLFTALTNALDWLNISYYNETNVLYDNWFDWEVSSALSLNDITVLLHDDLTPQQIANYMAAVHHFTPAPAYTSANKVWTASVVGVRGVITQNETNLIAARDALSDIFPYVTSGEGFYGDGSFIFHDVFAYNGHYGVKLIETLGPLMQLLRSSPWEVTDPAQTNIFRWVCESFEPFIYDGAMMQMVSGRAYTRTGDDHVDGHDAIAAILRIAQFAEPNEAAIYKAMIKHWISADRYSNFIASRGVPYNLWAKQIRDDDSILSRGPMLGHFQFPRMERTVHLRPGWGFAVATSSKRVGNFESLRGENLHGWYTGDGMTYLYNSDQAHYADKFWPTVNPYRLPGTTVDSQPRTNGSGQDYLSPNIWSAGASLGSAYGEINGRQEVGVAGTILRSWNSSLTARKSWFMFDDEIVCLGAGITADDERRIETIVENRLLTGHGNNGLTVNDLVKSPLVGWSETMTGVSWAHLEGSTPGSDIGYYFPTATTVKGLRESRGGSFFDLNTKFGSTNAYSRNFLTLWIDHGVDPSAATYRYVLLPGKTANEVAAYAQAPDIVVLRNNSDAHAVQETRLNVTAVNFWRDMSNRIANIYTDRRSSVIVRDTGGIIDVGITDAIHTNSGVLSFEYNGPASAVLEMDPAMTVVRLTPSIRCVIDLTNAYGRCFRARFYNGPVQTFTNMPLADAYVQNGDQSVSNFGASATLALKSSATILAREAYLRFQLASQPGPLLGATLRLMPITKNDPVLNHGLAFVPDNSWTETGITWDNKPLSEPQFAAWALPNPGTPALIPVTALAERSLAADGLLSLRLFSTGTPLATNGFAAYASRENSLTNRPFITADFGKIAPTINLTAPAQGSVFGAPGTISIVASPLDFDGVVTNVDLFNGAARVARRDSPPWSATLSNLAAGSYTFTGVASDDAGLVSTSAPVTVTIYGAEPPGAGTGLIGEYYGTENFTSLGFARTDSQINFDWGAGSPGGAVPNNRFSVRWAGRLQARRAGLHWFYLTSDNGARLWIDGRVVVDDMAPHNLAEKGGSISLLPGRYYDIAVEYFDITGPAAVQFHWQEPAGSKELVPQSQLYPVLNGLVGTYYSGTNLSNAVFTRIDEAVNFAWGESSPDAVLLPGSFSIRWTGKVRATSSGMHSFYTTSDDGVRLRIGAQTIISNWSVHTAVQNTGTVSLVAGQVYDLALEYFNATGTATVVLAWAPPGHSKQLLTSAHFTPYNYNEPPTVSVGDFLRVTRGSNATLAAGAVDPDLPAQGLTFSLDGASPAWAAINSSSGLLTLAPPIATPVGIYPISVRITDNGVPAMTDAQTVSVLVTDDIIVPVTLIGTGAAWRYFDGGIDQGLAWRNPYFEDGSWARGAAPLGYGTGLEATTVSYGPSSSSKYVTTYFRRPFFVPDVTAIQSVTLRMIANDGVVVYVNGTEAVRSNLPNSTISYTNFATRRINGATNIIVQTVDPALLFDGMNVVAAEIHQNAANGADILFELELNGSAFVPPDVPVQIMPSTNGMRLLWPAQGALLTLYSSTSLVPPVVWTPVELFGASPVDIQYPYCFLDVFPTNQALFFRLQTP